MYTESILKPKGVNNIKKKIKNEGLYFYYNLSKETAYPNWNNEVEVDFYFLQWCLCYNTNVIVYVRP